VLLRRVGRVRVLQWVFFAGVLTACAASGEPVTLVWDGPDPRAAGYRIYYGIASGVYSFAIDVGPATSCAVPPDLVPGTTYFFAVTAYGYFGVESDFSSEIAYTPEIASVPKPKLRITSIFADDYGTVLSWPSEPGTFYRVLATPTLTDPVWVDVSGPLLAISRARLWTHIRTPGSSSMFYRVEVLSAFR
jgi:hypothetical protein